MLVIGNTQRFAFANIPETSTFKEASAKDEAIIREAFVKALYNKDIFKLEGGYSRLDFLMLIVGLIAIGGIIYLASQNLFSVQKELSWTAVALAGVAALKLGYASYVPWKVYRALPYFYLAFAAEAIRPYQNSAALAPIPEILLLTARPGNQRARNKGAYEILGWGDQSENYENIHTAHFVLTAAAIRHKLDINPKGDMYKDLNQKTELEQDLRNHGYDGPRLA